MASRSHAALVARQMGKVCVCGAAGVEIDYDKKTVTVGGKTFKEGDFLSIDGTAGTVYAGELETAPSEIITGLVNGNKAAAEDREVQELRPAHGLVREGHQAAASAPMPTPRSRPRTPSRSAPTGIGLTRTEHMFFEGDRIDAMREMILADNEADRRKALAEAAALSARGLRRHLQGAQGPARPRSACSIRRCTSSCRTTKEQQTDLAKKIGVHASRRSCSASSELHEFNPMLGHRGCRLGIAYPEITEMQARAIFEAAADVPRRRHQGEARGHDPAGRLQARSSTCRSRSSTASPRKSWPRRR